MEDQIDRRWRKSSYSGNGGGDCVEVGDDTRRVIVRDTKDRTGPRIAFRPAAWRRFTEQLKRSLSPARPAICKGARSRLSRGCPSFVVPAPPHGSTTVLKIDTSSQAGPE